MSRKYSAEEIDNMRTAIRLSLPHLGRGCSGEVEDRLRTYMQNGTAPDELAKWADKVFDERRRAEKEFEELMRDTTKRLGQ